MRLKFDPAGLKRGRDGRRVRPVAVLFGGSSTEREISLRSGNAVLEALRAAASMRTGLRPGGRPRWRSCRRRGFDRAFIALHGPGGEDGTVQGALECLGVPYTGSGVLGSAVGMDKLRTKRLAAAVGIATTDCVVLRGRRTSRPRSASSACR
jgi:D-alanine-D-alanine ligase